MNSSTNNLSAEFTTSLISMGLSSSQINKITQGLAASKINLSKCSFNEIIEWAARNDLGSFFNKSNEDINQTATGKKFTTPTPFDEIQELAQQKNRFFEQLVDEESSIMMKLLKKELCSMKKSKNETLQEYLRVLQEGEDLKEKCFLATRSIIFTLLDNLMNIKAKKINKVDISSLESLLLEIFSLRILSKNQNQTLYKKYVIFISKRNAEPSYELLTLNEMFERETPKVQTSRPKNGKSIQKKTERLSRTCKETELKAENADEFNEQGATNTDIYETDFKDLCVICINQQREIVYLPCAHLLTCKSCGPLLDECPICTQKVEKKLKIFWS